MLAGRNRLPVRGACALAVALILALPVTICPVARAELEQAPVLVVMVEPSATAIDPEAVRRAVAAELRVDVVDAPVVGALGVLSVELARAQVAMTYRSRDGNEVRRTVSLPEQPARQLEVIALLAGNLARDEAGELLARMRRLEEAGDEQAAADAEPEEAQPEPAAKPRPAQPRVAPAQPAPVSQDEVEPQVVIVGSALPRRLYNLTFWHPMALNPDSERYRLQLELGLVYSRVGAIEGLGFNLLLLDVLGPANGAALAGLLTRSGGRVVGFQGAGIGNLAQGALRGADGAFIFNLRGGAVRGAQAAGIVNLAGGPAEGAQVAGVFNWAQGSVLGAQLSGGLNLVEQELEGFQLGVANYAADVQGAQVGVVNIGRHVRGTQIGVVNVAHEIDGVPIGLVNIVEQGRTQAVVWSDTTTALNLGVKYLNTGVFTLLAAGTLPETDKLAISAALGGQLTLGRLLLDLDAMYSLTTRFEPGFADDVNHARLRASVGYELVPGFALFAGAGPELLEEQRGQFGLRLHALGGVTLF